MKILMNTQNYLVGGIPRVIGNMIMNINNVYKDFEFITVNLEKNELLGKNIHTINKGKHKKIEGYYNRSFFTQKFSLYKSIEEIENDLNSLLLIFEKIIKNEEPGLIIVNGTGIIPWALMKIGEKFNIPIIIYYHGSITIEENKKITDINSSAIYNFEKSFFKNNFGYIFPSLHLKEVLINKFNLEECNLFDIIIPNSIPLYFFHSPKLPIENLSKKIKIGFIMRWCDVKNKDFVIRFVNYIKSNKLNYLIYLITDKEDIALENIGKSNYIKIHKQLNHNELSKFLHNEIDIILCPSKFETYGNIAQESIACGTPALINLNMGVCDTFKKIGLDNFILDFDKLPMSEIEKLIKNTLKNGINKNSINKLKTNYNSKTINEIRYNFIKKYISNFNFES